MKNGSVSHVELPPADNLRGAVWMALNSVCFAVASATIKTIGPDLPSAEIVFLRCLVGMVILIPAFSRQGLGLYRTQRPGLHVVRILCAVTSMICGYYAIAHLPLATAVSLSFTRPLFMIIVAILFLGERVRWRRGLATVIGFCGVLVMLGPTNLGLEPASFIALLGAAAVSGALAVIRHQAAIEGHATIFAWFATGTTIAAFFPAILNWHAPTLAQWGLLAFIGISSSLGQYFLMKAFAIGEATVMNPIDYIQIVLAAVFGIVIYNEIPSLWTALGAVIIVSSTLYILLREARVKGTAAATAAAE